MLNVKALEREVRKDLLGDNFAERLFLSGALHSALEAKVWHANHTWGLKNVPVEIVWIEGGFIARTNDRIIQINAGNPYFSKEDLEKYYQLFGAVAHENAHRRYTNFRIMTDYAEDMEKGNTVLPDSITQEERGNMERLLAEAPKALTTIVLKIHNALEDGRIEDLFVQKDTKLRSLWEGLVKLREHTYSVHSPSYQELMANQDGPEFLAITQMLLTYGRFGKVEGLPQKGEIADLLREVFPLVDKFKAEPLSQGRMELLTEIVCKLSGKTGKPKARTKLS